MLDKFFTRIIVVTLAAILASYLLSGVHIYNFTSVIIFAAVLALLNAFIKPILIFLTLPITIVTLGLFLIILNIIMIKWAAGLVDGFEVDGWWTALLFSIIVTVVSWFVSAFTGDKKK